MSVLLCWRSRASCPDCLPRRRQVLWRVDSSPTTASLLFHHLKHYRTRYLPPMTRQSVRLVSQPTSLERQPADAASDAADVDSSPRIVNGAFFLSFGDLDAADAQRARFCVSRCFCPDGVSVFLGAGAFTAAVAALESPDGFTANRSTIVDVGDTLPSDVH